MNQTQKTRMMQNVILQEIQRQLLTLVTGRKERLRTPETFVFAGYYDSESANTNDARGNPESDPNKVTHTSDGKKINVTDTINRYLQQKLLSNWTLPIITTTMDPQINDRIATCSETPHTIAMPLTKEVVTDTACRFSRLLGM